ncbi:MAG: filamentous hemagglutinin N-terminal domain-containing protein [Sulfuritalea sp.]|nr:filamentous hemagglutinin N-terminal domain-containing protein [Sulfuritalea sp.]
MTTKRLRTRCHPLWLAIAAALSLGPAHAQLPTGAQVMQGTASIATVGKSMTIANSPNAILNWQGFSIAADAAVRFQQQSAASTVLNRVVRQDPSAILGQLTSNGRVFLINPNGILFGQGARIDVAGLVASTLNITDADFLANRLNFTATAGAPAGTLLNQGEIATPTGGQVYPIGSSVSNEGIVTSPNGEVILAAGNSATLVDTGTPNVRSSEFRPVNPPNKLRAAPAG